MSGLGDFTLKHLAGASQDKPLRLDVLAEKAGVQIGTMEAVAHDLRNAGAINLVRLTKGGETYDVAWPTGMAPRPVSREIIVNGLSAHDRFASQRAAHDALNRPESADSQATTEEEASMPRISKPSKQNATPLGKLQAACLDALKAAGGTPMFSDQVAVLVSDITDSEDSVAVTLRDLIKLGLASGDKQRSRNAAGGISSKAIFWVGDRQGDATETPVWDAGPQGGGDIYAPDESTVAAAAAQAVAQVPDPQERSPETYRPNFAIWSDGELSIDCGDEMIRLDASDVARLYKMLHGQRLAETIL